MNSSSAIVSRNTVALAPVQTGFGGTARVSKPLVASITIGKVLHRVLFRNALRICKLLYYSTSSTPVVLFGRWRVMSWQITAGIVIVSSLLTVGATHLGTKQVAYASFNSILEGAESSSVSSVQEDSKILSVYQNVLLAYHPEVLASAELQAREHLIARYLSGFNAPLTAHSATIAKQEHWKLILAISFAESTFGRSCIGNNCSGIGGSNPVVYASIDEWISALNRLLEKRYKNNTLQQMCGVYVQPCNPHWLRATTSVLEDLEKAGIR